eukprot:gene27871-12048_t
MVLDSDVPAGRASAPYMHHATASRVVKGEDVMFVRQLSIKSEPQSMLYMVCDGHSGVNAANYVATNFLRLLEPKLPSRMPDISQRKEVEQFSEELRKALCEAFVRLDNDWAKNGHFAGTTVTAVITTGWLLTVANVGDSSAIVDTGMLEVKPSQLAQVCAIASPVGDSSAIVDTGKLEVKPSQLAHVCATASPVGDSSAIVETGSAILELTKSHRIHDNKEEQTRLKSAGCTLASLGFHLQGPAKPNEPGVGPIRIWPGGLCVSRSIGDLDAGKEVVPVPHIRQLLIPAEGCRVISASDGLWDVLSLGKAAKLARPKSAEDAVQTLMSAVMKDLRTLDDTSIIILDCLPSKGSSFPLVALKAGRTASPDSEPIKLKSNGGGFFACFRPSMPLDDIDDGHKLNMFYTDVDCLKAYPGLKAILSRNSMQRLSTTMKAAPPLPSAMVNYTLHGGHLYASRNAGANAKNAGESSQGGSTSTPSQARAAGVNKQVSSGGALSPGGSSLQPASSLDTVLAREVPQAAQAPAVVNIPNMERACSGKIISKLSHEEREAHARLSASAHNPLMGQTSESAQRANCSHALVGRQTGGSSNASSPSSSGLQLSVDSLYDAQQ